MTSVQPTLFGEPPLPIPAARHADPWTSHAAARRVRETATALHRAIWDAVLELGGEATQFQIAAQVLQVFPGRWNEATVRTACKRAGLVDTGRVGFSPSGCAAKIWRLP
jgi:hypothetical protein